MNCCYDWDIVLVVGLGRCYCCCCWISFCSWSCNCCAGFYGHCTLLTERTTYFMSIPDTGNSFGDESVVLLVGGREWCCSCCSCCCRCWWRFLCFFGSRNPSHWRGCFGGVGHRTLRTVFFVNSCWCGVGFVVKFYLPMEWFCCCVCNCLECNKRFEWIGLKFLLSSCL